MWPKFLEQTEFFYSEHTSSDSSGEGMWHAAQTGQERCSRRAGGEKVRGGGDPPPQARTLPTTCPCGSISS